MNILFFLLSFLQLKENLAKSGLDRDWKSMFAKLTNTVEPYMYAFSEQLGEALNTAVRQQQNGVLQKVLIVEFLLKFIKNNLINYILCGKKKDWKNYFFKEVAIEWWSAVTLTMMVIIIDSVTFLTQPKKRILFLDFVIFFSQF